MNVVVKGWSGTGGQGSRDRREKVLLVVLAAILVGVLAFEVPRILGRSGSSSEPSAVAVPQPATQSATESAAGSTTGAASSAGPLVTAAAVKALRGLPSKDPFAPAVSATDGATVPPSPPGTAAANDPFAPELTATPEPDEWATTPATTTATPATSTPATTTTAKPATSTPATTTTAKPATSKPAATTTAKASTAPSTTTAAPATKPPKAAAAAPVFVATSAVIWTNGHRRSVGLNKLFTVGDTSFRLVGLTRTAAKIRVVGGAFEGGARVITTQRGETLTLTNVATGVQYVLHFTLAKGHTVTKESGG